MGVKLTKPDYYRAVANAVARQREAADGRSKSAALDRAAARVPASVLTIGDITDLISEALRTQNRELVGHQTRMFTLLKNQHADEEARIGKIHRRLFEVESLLRRMQKGKP